MKRLRPTTLLTFLLVSITGLLFATGASAQTAPATFSGVWKHAADASESKQRLAEIDSATSDMSAFIRGTARKKLKKQTTPSPQLTLKVSEQRFEVKGKDDKGISLGLGAKPIEISRDDKKSKLSAQKKGDKIILLAEGENGSRTTTYALSPDGQRLTLSIRLNGKRLSAPLEYKLTYRRADTPQKPAVR